MDAYVDQPRGTGLEFVDHLTYPDTEKRGRPPGGGAVNPRQGPGDHDFPVPAPRAGGRLIERQLVAPSRVFEYERTNDYFRPLPCSSRLQTRRPILLHGNAASGAGNCSVSVSIPTNILAFLSWSAGFVSCNQTACLPTLKFSRNDAEGRAKRSVLVCGAPAKRRDFRLCRVVTID